MVILLRNILDTFIVRKMFGALTRLEIRRALLRLFGYRVLLVIAGWTLILTLINFVETHRLIYANLVQQFDVGIGVWTVSILPLSALAAYLVGDPKQAIIGFLAAQASSSVLLYLLLTLPIHLGIVLTGAPILQTQSIVLVGFRAILSGLFSLIGVVVGGLVGER